MGFAALNPSYGLERDWLCEIGLAARLDKIRNEAKAAICRHNFALFLANLRVKRFGVPAAKIESRATA